MALTFSENRTKQELNETLLTIHHSDESFFIEEFPEGKDQYIRSIHKNIYDQLIREVNKNLEMKKIEKEYGDAETRLKEDIKNLIQEISNDIIPVIQKIEKQFTMKKGLYKDIEFLDISSRNIKKQIIEKITSIDKKIFWKKLLGRITNNTTYYKRLEKRVDSIFDPSTIPNIASEISANLLHTIKNTDNNEEKNQR